MPIAIFFLFVLSSDLFATINDKCSDLKANFDTSSITCYTKVWDDGTDEIIRSNNINHEIQGWLWLREKISEGIKDNKSKEDEINESIEAFTAAKKFYPDNDKFIDQIRLVESAKSEYEKLFQIIKEESIIQRSLAPCYGTRFKCSMRVVDELKVKLAAKRAEKMSLLATNPLLTSGKVRESIEDQIETYWDFQDGKLKDEYSSLDNLEAIQRTKRRESFGEIMIQGLQDNKQILQKREEKWKKFLKKYQKAGLTQVSEKQKPDVLSNLLTDDISDVEEDESEIVAEILGSVNLDEAFSDPYLGQSICKLHARNQSQIDFEENLALGTDIALFVTPFALAKLYRMGAMANWGMKARFTIPALAEGGVILKDSFDIMEKASKCRELFALSISSNLSVEEKEQKHSEVENCKEEVDNQMLIHIGGAAMGPLAFVYARGGASASQLSDEAKQILFKFIKVRKRKGLNKYYDELDLPKGDRAKLNQEFDEFSKNSNLKGRALLKAFKDHTNQKYFVRQCTI